MKCNLVLVTPQPDIRRATNFAWQKEWENNNIKLHYVKPHIEEWESAHICCRQYEVKLSKLYRQRAVSYSQQ